MKFTRKTSALIALVFALVMLAIDTLLGAHHGGGVLTRPAAMGIFGFVGAWVLIIIAKIFMAPLLQKDESYYDRGDDDDAE